MNFLAHALVASLTLPDTGGQEITGSIMADFFTGQSLSGYPCGIQTGIRQHRTVDLFTDRHPVFIETRALIAGAGAPRSTAGILVDIFWDYILATEWDGRADGCGYSLDGFGTMVYGCIDATRHWHSPRFSGAGDWMRTASLLSTYATVGGIRSALAGLSRRMSGNIDLASSVDILIGHEGAIRRSFGLFWPDLFDHATTWATEHGNPG